jgi:hypothetical protein
LHASRRFRTAALLAIVLASSACGQSPLVPFLRSIDQAASWVAAIRYAHDLESRRYVPRVYLKQIVGDGTTEIQTLRKSIAEAGDVPATAKSEAVTLCDEVVGVLTSGDAETLDIGRLTQVETALRALARKAGGT